MESRYLAILTVTLSIGLSGAFQAGAGVNYVDLSPHYGQRGGGGRGGGGESGGGGGGREGWRGKEEGGEREGGGRGEGRSGGGGGGREGRRREGEGAGVNYVDLSPQYLILRNCLQVPAYTSTRSCCAIAFAELQFAA